MPVYLFTFHAYQSWMPDHRRGYTRRYAGYLPPDPDAAGWYRRNADAGADVWRPDVQRALIDAARAAAKYQRLRVYAVAADPTHLHVLVGWRDDRPWQAVRRNLKTSLSRRLREAPPPTAPRVLVALSRGGSRKRVKDRAHFDYLRGQYLPAHQGARWDERP